MILAHHRVEIELDELRRAAPPPAGGTRIAKLVGLAAGYGLVGRPVRLEPEDLDDLALPAILHWELSHFVVLERLLPGAALIADPAVGRRRISRQDLAKRFTGVAVEFKPTSTLTPTRRLLSASLDDLWTRVRGARRAGSGLVLLSVAVQVLLLLGPLTLSALVDDALSARSPGLIVALAGMMLTIAILAAAGEALRRAILGNLGASLHAQLNLNLVRHLVRLPFPYFVQRKLNDVLARLDSTRVIRDVLTEDTLPSIVDGLFAMLTLAVVLVISPPAALVLALTVGLYAVLRAFTFTAVRERTQAALVALTAERGVLTDTLRGVATVKVLGIEAARLSAWSGASLSAQAAEERRRAALSGLVSVRTALGSASLAVVVVVAALDVLAAGGSMGALVAVLLYRAQFQERALLCVDRLTDLQLLRLHLERLADITAAPLDPPVAPRPAAGVASVEILEGRDLWFRHAEDGPWILRGVSLSVRPGEFVAVRGPSGGGKTTLLRVLVGLLRPERGLATIDGQDVTTRAGATFRDSIGVVLQDDHLFAGTVLENITSFDSEPDVERARRCAETAEIDADINALPLGYLTLMGDMGATLSGGQRQRMYLARALYREPRLLVLDEGTANLDGALEARILTQLRRAGVAILCVAHRPAAIEMADRVLTLCAGQLTEDARDPASSLRRVGA